MRIPSTQALLALSLSAAAPATLGAFQAPAPSPAPSAAPAAPASPSAPPTISVPFDESLPPADEHVKTALSKSPRHHEWADVKVEGSPRTIRTFVAYPERKDKAGAVIVIHENTGLTDWARGVADQLAEDGFIALAPDLLSGKGPGGGNTDAIPSRDEATKAIRGLTDEETMAALDGVRAYALKLPAASGKVATVGFCWGGGRSFAYAVHQPALDAAIVYYGTAPEPARLPALKAPVLGLYGGDDARVNATIEPTATEAKKLGKSYRPEIFDGAGHGFLRAQGGRDGANLKATQKAWPSTLEFLRDKLGK
jgi:carboxymethylenebutenolidase